MTVQCSGCGRFFVGMTQFDAHHVRVALAPTPGTSEEQSGAWRTGCVVPETLGMQPHPTRSSATGHPLWGHKWEGPPGART